MSLICISFIYLKKMSQSFSIFFFTSAVSIELEVYNRLMSVSRLTQMLDNLGAESDQLTASMNIMDEKNKELSQIATRNII